MIDGIINIKKEAGFTSHDVVAKLRGIVHQKKIGHTGTLDPDAVGVLPVCFGKATKVCDLIGDWDKTYEAVLLLGRETDTEDTSGTTKRECPVEVSEEAIREIILSFVGEYDQIPPMYSAKKVNGKKLYELAREGIEIERKPCHVTLSEIVIKEIALPYVTFEVTCSKGTYIRSLCRDIGAKAGCGGCMAHLTRTRVAHFQLEAAYTLSQVEEAMKMQGNVDAMLYAIDSVFLAYPEVHTTKALEKAVYNGNILPKKDCILGEGYAYGKPCRVYDHEGDFVGVYEEKQYMLKPIKLFFSKGNS